MPSQPAQRVIEEFTFDSEDRVAYGKYLDALLTWRDKVDVGKTGVLGLHTLAGAFAAARSVDSTVVGANGATAFLTGQDFDHRATIWVTDKGRGA